MQEGNAPNPHLDAEQRRFRYGPARAPFPSWTQRRDPRDLLRATLVQSRQKRQKTADERFDVGDQTIRAAEIQTVAVGLPVVPQFEIAPRNPSDEPESILPRFYDRVVD